MVQQSLYLSQFLVLLFPCNFAFASEKGVSGLKRYRFEQRLGPFRYVKVAGVTGSHRRTRDEEEPPRDRLADTHSQK